MGAQHPLQSYIDEYENLNSELDHMITSLYEEGKTDNFEFGQTKELKTTTDIDGQFLFPEISKGIHEIEIIKEGFETQIT